MSRLDRSWNVSVVLLLFLPVWWWLGLPPLWSPVDLAEHYAEMGDHSEDHCSLSQEAESVTRHRRASCWDLRK